MTTIDQQLANWREQKKHRVSLGDMLDEPRDLDHVIVFRSRSRASAAAQTLREAGFRVGMIHGLLRTTVQATRADSLDDAAVENLLRDVVTIATAHRGRYDGFGGEVVPGARTA